MRYLAYEFYEFCNANLSPKAESNCQRHLNQFPVFQNDIQRYEIIHNHCVNVYCITINSLKVYNASCFPV